MLLPNTEQLFESVQPLLQKGHMKNLLCHFIHLLVIFIPLLSHTPTLIA